VLPAGVAPRVEGHARRPAVAAPHKEEPRALYGCGPRSAPAHLGSWVSRSNLAAFVKLGRTHWQSRDGVLAAIGPYVRGELLPSTETRKRPRLNDSDGSTPPPRMAHRPRRNITRDRHRIQGTKQSSTAHDGRNDAAGERQILLGSTALTYLAP
jgi:hypothetical protein